MNDIIIIGAGGLGQEVAWLIEEINADRASWNLLGYLDSFPGIIGKEFIGYPVLGGFEDAANYSKASFIVAFGDPFVRRRVVESTSFPGMTWANLYSPTVRIHRSHRIGNGVVIGRYSDLTISCIIGNHVMLNIHTVLGHSVRIGDYSIVSPNAVLNGEAQLGSCCAVGANAFVRDVRIGDNVIIGASSCVVRDVEPDVVVAGVPAKVISRGRPTHSVTKSERRQ